MQASYAYFHPADMAEINQAHFGLLTQVRGGRENYAGARARENEDDTYVGRPDGGSGSERSI